MEQRFGGTWTAEKLAALEYYLRGYAQALKHQPFELHYIDAFAGSGSFVPGEGGQAQRGSAMIALDVAGFQQYHFFELKKEHCRQLEALIPPEKRDRVDIRVGDANKEILELLARLPRRARAVMFLDPYGMHVEWTVLQAIRKTRQVDVWYLFPLSGITRQMAKRSDRVDKSKAAALDRVLGTSDWRNVFYEASPMQSLFGDHEPDQRSADVTAIEAWLTERLKGEFPAVIGPKLLRRPRKVAPSAEADLFGESGNHARRPRAPTGPRLFALYCLISNPAAVNVAKPIAKGVFDRLEKEERAQS